jgi:CheY-like chemotaxis protein
VDNDEVSNEVVGSYLDAWGIQKKILRHGADVVGALRESEFEKAKYDLILIGQSAGAREGFDLASDLHLQLQGTEPKMILMSAFEVQFKQEQLQQSCFAAVISKPLKQSQFFDSIVQTLSNMVTKDVIDYSSIGQVSLLPKDHKAYPAQATGGELRVLVADDVSTNQILVLKLLESLGYSGRAVANGREAVEALEMSSYDLVLMDCQMPEMDGFEATKVIRQSKDPRIAATTIIALTANAMSGDREKCIEAGMNDYLSKPIRKDKLAAILKTWTSEYRKAA